MSNKKEFLCQANEDYIASIGGWNGIKAAFRIVKIARKVKKEVKNSSK